MLIMLRRIVSWIDSRLHLSELFASTAGHPVPASSASWFYVFGSGTLVCFVIQIITGICLAFVYSPSASEAHASLEYLNYAQPLGWLLRAIHYWGSTFMVALMTAHMAQVFLFGAFKYPRELTWISGVALLFCTLGLAFTGQVLRFDQDAYWGLGIGAAVMGRVPLIGANLVNLMLGGPIIAGKTLLRFFALHVFILPGLLIAIVGLHLRLVLTKGINEYPTPGKLVEKGSYEDEYRALLKKEGVPFFPNAFGKDLAFAGLVVLGIVFCAIYFGPKGPEGVPDPTMIDTKPRPDFFFLSLFAALALIPDYLETLIILTAPVVLIVILLALPFISGTGEKSVRRRPAAALSVIVIFLALGTLTYLGADSPWSPHMGAWSGDALPEKFVKGRSPLELRGAATLQNKQCRNCHSLGGEGGRRGPALDYVATRLTEGQLTRQVIQGGGNMPAYGKNLSPAEVSALVTFMRTLRGPNEMPARDSAVPGRPGAGEIRTVK
jgi:ubiquinol-cytochrome c reductase cytochrome b subunit